MYNNINCLLAISVIAFIAAPGCVQPAYRYGVGNQASFHPGALAQEVENQPSNLIMYGGKYPRLDRIESAAKVPVDFVKKHMPFKKKKEKEEKPPEDLRTEAILLSHRYIRENRLTDVHVDVRRYEPVEQWERLKANEQMSPLMKYTGGSLSVVKYSLLPGRLFGSDEYNPYTNTLSLNSTKPIEALCEAGSAKVYHQQRWPGIYATSQNIPFVPLGHKSNVASDVITYARLNGLKEMEKELYPHTYGDIAKTSVAQTFSLFPVGTGVTQFVVPFVGEFVAENVGELAGKAVAKDAASRQEVAERSEPATAAAFSGGFLPSK